jgi:hypothetical protein
MIHTALVWRLIYMVIPAACAELRAFIDVEIRDVDPEDLVSMRLTKRQHRIVLMAESAVEDFLRAQA